MCGIAGAFALDPADGPPLDRDALRRMTDAIAHRGPDDAGLVLEGGLALGARRLSIVDVEHGRQPMANEDATVWAAQNGEIYNHERLAAYLRSRGHALRTRCDTEVLPHLWEELGEGLCERLRGKFAVAAWDERRRRGLLARDRLGVKPLYYAVVDGGVVFGSELKCLAASGLVGDRLDPEAIASYLALGFVPAPLTPLAGVRKLLPGERLVVAEGRAVGDRYWTYPVPSTETAEMSDREAAQELIEALDESVRARLMSDVPLGAMLSGGLDSSVLVALMAQHGEEPVKTFAVGFEAAGAASELADARRVAVALGTEHHELELPLAGSEEDLARLAWHLDEPLADLSALGFLPLCELASRHVTVALAGQGADELLGGYRRHRLATLVPAWERLPQPLRATLAGAAGATSTRLGGIAAALQAPDPAARLMASVGLLRGDVRRELYAGALAEHASAGERAVRRRLAPARSAPPGEAAMYLEAQLGLADDRLHYFDRASMACSLEVRVPFLDHHVVELCARLPPRAKVGLVHGKRALRLGARELVPGFVLERRKRGFLADSLGSWLGAGAAGTVDRLLLAPEPRLAELVEPAAVRRLVGAWRAGGAEHGRAVLALAMLELWLADFRPRAFAGASAPPRPAAVP